MLIVYFLPLFATLINSSCEQETSSDRRKGGEEVNALYSSREIHTLKSCTNIISNNESELCFYGPF